MNASSQTRRNYPYTKCYVIVHFNNTIMDRSLSHFLISIDNCVWRIFLDFTSSIINLFCLFRYSFIWNVSLNLKTLALPSEYLEGVGKKKKQPKKGRQKEQNSRKLNAFIQSRCWGNKYTQLGIFYLIKVPFIYNVM